MKKILYIKQTDLRDCGVACLMAIVNYYGGNVSREYLRELTRTTKDGVSLYSLVAASEKLGFETKAIRGNVWKVKEHLPVIAHLLINKQYGHFVIITKMDEKTLTIMDPDGGYKSYGFKVWNEMSTDVYLLLKPRCEILKQAQEKSFWQLLFPVFKCYKFSFFLLFLFSLINTICNVLISYQFQFFLDAVSLNNLKTLNLLFCFLIIVIFLKETTNLFRNNLTNYINHQLELSLIKEVYNHIIKLPYLYFKNRTKGDIITRLKDVFVIRDVISKLLVTITIDGVLVIGLLIVMFNISSKLTYLVLIVTFFYVFIIILANSFLTLKMKALKEKEVLLNNHLIESLTSINTIKGMQLEEILNDRLHIKNKDLEDVSFSLYHNYYKETFFKDLIYGFGLLLIIFIGFKDVLNGNFQLSRLLVFNSLLIYFFTPIQNICSLQIILKEASISFTRIKELLNINKENFLLDEKIIHKNLEGNILIQNLSYSYNGIDNVIRCSNLEIKAGEHVLLYGISGGGKSTLMKLLTRYLDNYEGEIYLDNRKIYNYNLKELRKKITYVSQEETLFTDTLYNNIVFDHLTSYDDYLKIIKICGVEKIMERSLVKDEMLLSENAANLSGGERQRIIIARALLKNSDIYIFDEAFNALDIKNERIMLENIFSYLKKKTVIVISHRFNNHDLYQKFVLIKGGMVYEY